MKRPEWYATFHFIIALAPFWFRFWQCINKGVKQNNKAQFVNAGKYMSKLIIPLVGLFASKKFSDGGLFWSFFSANMFATLYCLYWDYVWDWGLCRG